MSTPGTFENATAVSLGDITVPENNQHNTLQLLLMLTVHCAIILATVIGNAFVIAAVILERNLRTHVANYLVASLAMADMMVAVLVMPVAAVKDVSIKRTQSTLE